MQAAKEFIEADDRDAPPREGWRTAIARICMARRGASLREIIADLAERDLYPADTVIASSLCQMVRSGFVRNEKGHTCASCHHPRTLYYITSEGRIAYSETGA